MDLICGIGIVLLILQASLSLALSMRLKYAISAVELLPLTMRNVGLGCVGIMFVNSLFNVYLSGVGHFSACLAFSVALTLINNESLARELKRANSLEVNLMVLKKQASQQQEGFNQLLKSNKDSVATAELQSAKAKVENLKIRVAELELENKHLTQDRASIKKDK